MNDNWQTVDIPTHTMKNCRWVRVIAHIRNNATGEIRQYMTDEVLHDGDSHPSVFNWEENNFSCDCNRILFFLRAKGEDEEEAWDRECTHGHYSVNLQNPVTGETYYREFKEQ